MVKNTTLAEFQAAEIEPIREPSPLAQLAERMVRERSGDQPDEPLVCSVCGDEIDAAVLKGGNPSDHPDVDIVVLCASCGDEEIIDDGLDGEAAG